MHHRMIDDDEPDSAMTLPDVGERVDKQWATRVKTLNETARTLEFTITTLIVDRAGEVVVPAGGRFQHYLETNPIVLFGHNAHDLPIASTESIVGSQQALIAAARFAGLDQLHPFAETVYRLYRDRFLRAVSIGFVPVTVSQDRILPGQTGPTYRDWELLEFSAVPIPANPQALVRLSKALNLPSGATEKDFLQAIHVQKQVWFDVAQAILKRTPSGPGKLAAMSQTTPNGPSRQVGVIVAQDVPVVTTGLSTSPTTATVSLVSNLSGGAAQQDHQAVSPLPQLEEEIRWNTSLSKAFDIEREPSTPANVELVLVSRYLDCAVKMLARYETGVPAARMGSFLASLDEVFTGCQVDDVRNIRYDGTETPPLYETIQLTSTRRNTFLVDGTRFVEHQSTQERMTVKVEPDWSGLVVSVYGHLKSAVARELLDTVWRRTFELNFLKGEAFSLGGQFLPKTEETWDDLFLSKENLEPLQRAVALINEKGAALVNRGILLIGPPGCLHGDTAIYDPVDKTTQTVRDREQCGRPFYVWALDNSARPVVALAEAPWKYDPAEMVQFTFASGRRITVTLGHRFWVGSDQEGTGRGCFVTAQHLVGLLHEGRRVELPSVDGADGFLQGSVDGLLASTLESGQPIRGQGVARLRQTLEDSLTRCSMDSHLCDEQLLPVEDIDRWSLQFSAGVQEHTPLSWHEGGRGGKDTRTFQKWSDLHSTMGCISRIGNPLENGLGSQPPVKLVEPTEMMCPSVLRLGRAGDPSYRGRWLENTAMEASGIAYGVDGLEQNQECACVESGRLVVGTHRVFEQSDLVSNRLGSRPTRIVDRPSTAVQVSRLGKGTFDWISESDTPDILTVRAIGRSPDEIAQSRRVEERHQTKASMSSYQTPPVDSNGYRKEYTTCDRLVKAESAGVQPYYDFHVPGYENYWATGFFHHNTGKTLGGRIIRNIADATFIWVSARDFWRSGAFGGISYAFSLAKECAPSILFVEDIDNWLDGYSIDLLKTEMDGIGRSSGVVTILTTNYPELLPAALIDRPGRFHDVLQFNLPDATARRAMLARWLPAVVESNALMTQAVHATDGYSGAHVRELASFVLTIQEQDGLALGDALTKAIEKLQAQRDLITSVQTSGSRYRPTREFETDLHVTPPSGVRVTMALVKKSDFSEDELRCLKEQWEAQSRSSEALVEKALCATCGHARASHAQAGACAMSGCVCQQYTAKRRGETDGGVTSTAVPWVVKSETPGKDRADVIAVVEVGRPSQLPPLPDQPTVIGTPHVSGKSGRVLSAKNLGKLQSALALLQDVILEEETRRAPGGVSDDEDDEDEDLRKALIDALAESIPSLSNAQDGASVSFANLLTEWYARDTEPVEIRPLPSEHACRLNPPSKYAEFRRGEREHDGKTYGVIYGKVTGGDTWEDQSLRYPKETWSVDEARSHCGSHEGSFEAARGDEKDDTDVIDALLAELTT